MLRQASKNVVVWSKKFQSLVVKFGCNDLSKLRL